MLIAEVAAALASSAIATTGVPDQRDQRACHTRRVPEEQSPYLRHAVVHPRRLRSLGSRRSAAPCDWPDAGTKLCVLHVVEEDLLENRMREAIRNAEDDLRAALGAPDGCEIAVISGHAFHVIAEEARTRQAVLIVMGAHYGRAPKSGGDPAPKARPPAAAEPAKSRETWEKKSRSGPPPEQYHQNQGFGWYRLPDLNGGPPDPQSDPDD